MHSNNPTTVSKRPVVAVAAVLGVLVLAAGLYFYGPGQLQRHLTSFVRAPEPVTFGLAHESLAALAMIAKDRGFFADAGLDATFKEYASGKNALKGLLKGEVQLATTADIPIAFDSFDRQDFTIVSTIGSSDNEPRIIARKDAGIDTPADLRGKKVATQKASAVHFFLHVFLLQSGLTTDDVKLSYLKAEELAKALAAGEIDAFSMREPYISEAAKLIGQDKVVVFAKPGLYRKTFNVVAEKAVVQDKPEVVERALRALMQAEAYAIQHPAEAIAIVAKTLKAPNEEIAAIWSDASLKVSLDQSLLVGLEDEAKWIASNKFTANQAPNYLDLIHIDALKAVDPVLVSLIR